MKNKHLLILTVFVLIGKLDLHASDSTNSIAASLKLWQAISNQWSSVSLSQVEQAAGQSNVGAQYYLGRVYSDGIGVARDQNEAFKWMQAAARQGMARAQLRLGWMLQSGAGVATNALEAVEWFRKAAEQGDEKPK